jgi:hypothetical protein
MKRYSRFEAFVYCWHTPCHHSLLDPEYAWTASIPTRAIPSQNIIASHIEPLVGVIDLPSLDGGLPSDCIMKLSQLNTYNKMLRPYLNPHKRNLRRTSGSSSGKCRDRLESWLKTRQHLVELCTSQSQWNHTSALIKITSERWATYIWFPYTRDICSKLAVTHESTRSSSYFCYHGSPSQRPRDPFRTI